MTVNKPLYLVLEQKKTAIICSTSRKYPFTKFMTTLVISLRQQQTTADATSTAARNFSYFYIFLYPYPD